MGLPLCPKHGLRDAGWGAHVVLNTKCSQAIGLDFSCHNGDSLRQSDSNVTIRAVHWEDSRVTMQRLGQCVGACGYFIGVLSLLGGRAEVGAADGAENPAGWSELK